MAKKHGKLSSVRSLTAGWLGATVFALLLAAVMLIYAWTVFDGARSVVDWLLIVPAAVLGAVLLMWSAITARKTTKRSEAAQPTRTPTRYQPIALLVLILVYAVSLPVAGFDVGTALFLAVALLLQGERRLWLIAINALLGAGFLVWVFRDLLLVRLPTLIL